ncbi:ROK family protein [Labrys sp. KNU-23]|uniref:ROK family protein n=1 Tax=Labrys sp. KNU-23 TaxID=2789216 RepID=UPI0011EE03D9|nr:ROK family protein [Labrys sp. KNU-23]QEN88466.1 ROK family protein [Labrys sp. KNU-23]
MSRRAIGIDLGGTQVRAALVDVSGTVLKRAATRTDVAGGPAAVMAQFRSLIEEVTDDKSLGSLSGIGVCAPGPLDSLTGTFIHVPTLPGWEDFPLRDELAAALGRPVVVEGDAIAACYGEWRFGAGRGLDHLLYVTVSTGIGGGVVSDGRLLHGRRGMTAHVGHFRLAGHGPRCSCGTIGCFEAFAAGTALDGRAREAALAHPGSLLARLSAPTAGSVVEAARQGDAAALALLDEEATYLGEGFASLIHLYSPEKVVMGGGVAHGFDLMTEKIHQIIRTTALPSFRDVPVVKAALGDNAGLVGAAALVLFDERAR